MDKSEIRNVFLSGFYHCLDLCYYNHDHSVECNPDFIVPPEEEVEGIFEKWYKKENDA